MGLGSNALVYAILVFVYVHGIELPSYIPRKGKCPVEGASACLKERIEFYLPYIIKGVPEFGMQPSEPLHISHLNITQGSGAVQVDADFSDLVVHDLTNFAFEDFNLDTKTWKTFSLKTRTPLLRIEGKYKIKGKILLLPIHGEGDAFITAKNTVANYFLDMQFVKRNGHLHIKFVNPVYDCDIGDVSMRMENLFNGQKLLGETMNRFLNENWRELFAEFQGPINKELDKGFRIPMQNVFDKFHLSELFDVDEEEVMKNHNVDIIVE